MTVSAFMFSRLRQFISDATSPRNLPPSTMSGSVMFTSSHGIFSLAMVNRSSVIPTQYSRKSVKASARLFIQ